MPALQVRDLPQDLYDGLKERAEREHRSLAQETIVAIEEHLSNKPQVTTQTRTVYPTYHFEDISGREERIAKRKALFARIAELNKDLPPTTLDPAELIREDRDAR